jgi:hypothetical protein
VAQDHEIAPAKALIFDDDHYAAIARGTPAVTVVGASGMDPR